MLSGDLSGAVATRGRRRTLRWLLAVTLVGVGCTGTGTATGTATGTGADPDAGAGPEAATVVVPEGDLTGDELRVVAEDLADHHGVPHDGIPASPTFEGGGTAVVTACFLAVDVLRGGQDQDAEVAGPRLDLVADMAVGHDEAATIRDGLVEVAGAIGTGDSTAFARGRSQVLDACTVVVGGG